MLLISILIPSIFMASAAFLIIAIPKFKSGENLRHFSERQISDLAVKQRDRSGIKNRLAELENGRSYREFRYVQFITSISFALIPIFLMAIGIFNFASGIGLSMIFGASVYFFMDRKLTTDVNNQRLQIESEFPSVIEILTLAISAGDTPISAFSRVAFNSNSLISKSMKEVIHKVKAGAPFHRALDEFSQSSKSIMIRRFVDALVISMTRGAPIVDVLHRHVAEARINHRNLVLNKAAKAEITMMIPIVFLILPISVLFALWPSMTNLSSFAS